MISAFLKKLAFTDPVYIRVRSDLLSIRNIKTKDMIEEPPLMAITKDEPSSILAVGTGAETRAAATGKEFILVNGFDHPRSIIADFTIAEKTIKTLLSKLLKTKLFRPSPIVVIQALEKTEGGLTQIEQRALLELAMGAGAREAYVWMGDELDDETFKTKTFSGDHWFPKVPEWSIR